MFVRKDGSVTGSLLVDGLPKKAKVPPWVGGVEVEEPSTGGELAAQIAEEREAQREGNVPVPASVAEAPASEVDAKGEPAKSNTGAASVKTSDTTGVAKGATAKGK